MKNKVLGTGESGYHPLRKVAVILSRLRFAVVNDFSVLYKMILSLIVLVPVLIFNAWIDASLVVLATGGMLAAVRFNTAIEAVCDFMKTDFDDKIGVIKDISAAATGIAIFTWLVVLLIEIIEFSSHFEKYL